MSTWDNLVNVPPPVIHFWGRFYDHQVPPLTQNNNMTLNRQKSIAKECIFQSNIEER